MTTDGTGAEVARALGQGWKVSPSINIGPKQLVTLAEITGPGAIQQIWLTVHPNHWRKLVFRFYWDGDIDFPTICGTGTEDYFGGAWNFEHPAEQYGVFSSPFSGLPQVIKPDGLYQSQQRFGIYRWHVMDPIRFQKDLRVTIQALGWRKEGYLPLKDDIASTVFWYQSEPHTAFPSLPGTEGLEVI